MTVLSLINKANLAYNYKVNCKEYFISMCTVTVIYILVSFIEMSIVIYPMVCVDLNTAELIFLTLSLLLIIFSYFFTCIWAVIRFTCTVESRDYYKRLRMRQEMIKNE